MLTELKFVQGAVGKKDLIPAMTHFVIEKGTVRSYNGTMALCSPLNIDIDCKPKAEPMVKAIANCNDTISLAMTQANRLKIQSGSFRAFIDCIQEETPHVYPDGQFFHVDGEKLLAAFDVVERFVGSDATRPWGTGVLLKGQSAFATNNVCLVEYWTGTDFPVTVNIPKMAVKELLRIGEPPRYAQVTDNSITFHFAESKWLRTQLYDLQWPDLGVILDKGCNPEPVDPALFKILETLKPFADKGGRVFFKDGQASTTPDGLTGAAHSLSWIKSEGIYNIEMLSLLEGIATHADFTKYPAPSLFYGDRLRGAIVGSRM